MITAVGEQVAPDLYTQSGVQLDAKGRPVVDENLMTTAAHIYAIGDGRRGPATVVKAIADAQTAAHAISGVDFDRYKDSNVASDPSAALFKKGMLTENVNEKPDWRCLGCPTVCEVCADVCPNRANTVVRVPGMKQPQIVHVDGMCNECGNCAVFCPYDGRPYRDKFTLFWSEEDFENSENSGFMVIPGGVRVRMDGKVTEFDPEKSGQETDENIRRLILAVIHDYPWMLG